MYGIEIMLEWLNETPDEKIAKLRKLLNEKPSFHLRDEICDMKVKLDNILKNNPERRHLTDSEISELEKILDFLKAYYDILAKS